MAMLFSQPLLVHRRETAHPVPPMKSVTAKVILKVSSDMHGHVVLSACLCIGGEKRPTQCHPVPTKVFLKVSPDSVLFSQSICV